MNSTTTKVYYLANRNYWVFSWFCFFYFFILGAYFPFFPIWLSDVNHLDKAETGLVFGCISFFALCLQPIFGILSDKLGMRKNLLWVITLSLVFFGPFFNFVLGPLLRTNVLLGGIVGGAYLGLVCHGGAPAVEAFIEKVSRRSHFEFGKARMFGCFGWGICASVTGLMYNINHEFIFWLGSGFALILVILLYIAKPESSTTAFVADKVGANQQPFSLRLALELLKMRKIWFFILYIIGVACIYDVFDQQFANFFTSFFSSPQEGREVFGYVTTMGEFLNAFVMFLAPWIVSRIGSKNTLLIAGMIMTVRITGSSFADSAVAVVFLKTLHMFEAPLLLVSAFKYITTEFEVRFSATIFLVAYCFFKQVATMFMSVFTGYMYEDFGFKTTYFILGMIALTFTFISAFTLSGRGPFDFLINKKRLDPVNIAVKDKQV